MKLFKIFSVIFLMQILSVYTFKLSAQKYYTLVDTNKLWSIQHIEVYPGNPSYSYYIKFIKDTAFRDTVYKQVMLSYDSLHKMWSNNGYIRETSDEKVYYLANNNNRNPIEYNLYNFNIKKGDIIGGLLVDSIDFLRKSYIVLTINHIMIY